MKYALTGIYGGTFNPIHHGHLRLAQEVADQLLLDEVKFIPSANPPHKSMPLVSAEQRAEMVGLAIANNPLFTLDTRESKRNKPSYTIDTIKSLYEEDNERALCLIMGSDAFMQFDTWHQWESIIQYCHIILVQRPNSGEQQGLNATLQAFMRDHYTEDATQLSTARSGLINMQAITAMAISSSQIRALVQQKNSPAYLTPTSVADYISLHKLYAN